MLRGLDDFIKKPLAYRKKFLLNCEIQEKISAFYFHVKVLSKSAVIIYKSDYREMKPEDVILNRMWKQPLEEIPEILLKNPEVTEQMVGWTLSFFYFPVAKPLVIEYDLSEGWSYMLAFAVDEHKKPIDTSIIDLSVLSPKIRNRGYLLKDHTRIQEEKKLAEQAARENTIDSILSFISKLVAESPLHANMVAKSLEEAEGVVLRNGSDIYQVVYNRADIPTKDNRLSLEFFMHSFCSWLRETDYTDLVKSSYVKSVCNLFYAFKRDWLSDEEKMRSFKYYNIQPEDLEAPTFGYYPGTCYDMIPHMLVRDMCMKDKMCDNMFKILVNALKKKKNMSRGESMLITDEDVEAWNTCVKFIKNYTNPMLYLNSRK